MITFSSGACRRLVARARSASPMCNIKYGPDAQLSVFDMATLAAAPYRKTGRRARFFDEMDKSGVKFVEFRVPAAAATQQPVSVVSIRGTANVEDILQDMYVWSTPGSFNSRLTATVVHFISKYVAHTTLLYDVEVDKYVKRLMRDGRHVIVTGHSLGGRIASIVAARNRIPALALSSPDLDSPT
ncbi:hypothetical protein BCR44DRAFT_1500138 [Catenaria anguillulae PL171]|uniref:Fungal lipase-type domain-containing protein n=1 Tax=Catenaria anguillulae PL171 TaxID=765915 RepID=A0A1Y2HK83_9FUNG|nr:hypothetical protein BCR44DRAFT_1500138 [Catenaria anguillulae PL171]